MSSEKTKKRSVLIVSNCTWYLYNFRKELISQLSDQRYYLILVSPLDNYYYRLKKYFNSKENLFLNRGSENPLLEIITIVNLLFIYIISLLLLLVVGRMNKKKYNDDGLAN